MKVAVMSLGESLGKSHLIATLAGVYSRSQQKSVAILSSGSAVDNVELVDVKVRSDDVANPHVFKAMLEAASKDDMSILDYGLRQGEENVYIFDIMDTSMEMEAKQEFLLECMDKLPTNLTLIEVNGRYDTEWNRRIMSNSDCFLVLIDSSKKGLRLAAEYRQKEKATVVARTAFVLAKYVPEVLGEKKIHKTTGISQQSLFQWPFNVQIAKMGYDGILDQAAYDLIIGKGTLIPLREKMQELMQFMFDSPQRPIIREVEKWSR